MRETVRIVFCLFVYFLAVTNAAAVDSYEERRIKAGVKFFQAMLAADLDINSKAGQDSALLILIAYESDKARAEQIADYIRYSGKGHTPTSIRKIAVRVEVTNNISSPRIAEEKVAAIFIGENLGKGQLGAFTKFGVARSLVVFSPFEGHVESGVLGGISVEAYVLPYVNMGTLAKSKIRLKAFFMKVVKRHE